MPRFKKRDSSLFLWDLRTLDKIKRSPRASNHFRIYAHNDVQGRLQEFNSAVIKLSRKFFYTEVKNICFSWKFIGLGLFWFL